MPAPESSGHLGNTGWTPETLLAHITTVIAAAEALRHAVTEANDARYAQRFADFAITVNAALAAAKEAVVKAEAASDKRFEGVNEFRQTLADQQRTLMPRAEVQVLLESLSERVTKLERANLGSASEHQGTKQGYGWAIGAVALVVTILGAIAAIMVVIQ